MTISPYEAYEAYSSMRLHFTSESYDGVKYNWKTKAKQSQEKFLKRRDKYFFAKLAKKFKQVDNLQAFLACNFMHRDPSWIGDFLQEDADRVYGQHIIFLEGFTGHLEGDIIVIRDKMLVQGLSTPNQLFTEIEPDTDFPYIINLYLRGEIRVETLIALDSVLGFLKNINIGGNLLWTNQYKKLKKYSRLMKPHIDNEKVRLLLKTIFYNEIKRINELSRIAKEAKTSIQC